MKRSVLLACVLLGALAPRAFAADYVVTGNLGQYLSASDNYFLSKAPLGSTFRSVTAGSLAYRARTLDTRLLLGANLSYFDYFGSGAAATSPQSGFPAGARFKLDHTTELNEYNLAASWNRYEVATTQLAESGFVASTGFLDNFRISGNITHDLNRTDSIGLAALARTVRYTNSTLTPFTQVGARGTWDHRFNPTTALTTSASFLWYDADNSTNTQQYYWQIATSLYKRLSERLIFDGSIGAAFSDTQQGAFFNTNQNIPNTGQNFNVPIPASSGSSSSVQAYIGLTYRLLESTTASFTALNALVPTTYGALQTISTVGVSLNHQINELSNLSFVTQFGYIDIGGNTYDVFSARVGYGYSLTPQLALNLAYTYQQRDGSAGFANASIGLVSLNYNFTVAGKPPPKQDKLGAEAERARRLHQSAAQAFPALNALISEYPGGGF